MLLKLLVFGALLYGLYRLLGGKLLPEKTKDSSTAKASKEDEETMIECEKCSTFVVKKEAIFYRGHYYCSRECLPHE